MGADGKSGPDGVNGSGEDTAKTLLNAVHASMLDVPENLSFDVLHTFSMDDLTDPGEEVHILHDVREPSRRYRYGLLVTSGERASTLLLTGTNGDTGHGLVLTEGGGTSEVGPRPGWATTEEWVEVAVETAVNMLMRRNESRNPEFESDRVRAHEHLPLLEYKERTGCPIRVRSWRLSKSVAIPDVEGARVELWTGILADGVITYAAIAAGYHGDGTIAALACVEGMPSAHDLAFLGMFTPDGVHQNLGPAEAGGDFLATAMPLLAQYLSSDATEADSS